MMNTRNVGENSPLDDYTCFMLGSVFCLLGNCEVSYIYMNKKHIHSFVYFFF